MPMKSRMLAPTRRLGVRVGLVFMILLLFSAVRLRQSSVLPPAPLDDLLSYTPSETTSIPLRTFPPQAAAFWARFRLIMIEHSPGRPEVQRLKKIVPEKMFSQAGAEWTRPNILAINETAIEYARKQHESVVKRINQLASEFPSGGDRRGIVTAAGGALMPVFVVSLKMLRRSGCMLPVEIFVADQDEYEARLCEEVFPSLNAKCLVLKDYVEYGLTSAAQQRVFQISKYQTKPFAMLFSSFDEILLLDADNFAISDPEFLFDSDPFMSTGLVTWPDYWCPTQSPIYYHISNTTPPLESLRSSTESGQIMYDKRRHIRDILLVCYYTYYGPDLYFPLLTQGYPGEGDKDTYLAAAQVMNAPFYNVGQPPGVLFHHQGDGSLNGVAMTQMNPIDDYKLRRLNQTLSHKEARQAFIHHHHPKLNAVDIMNPANLGWGASLPHDRMWGAKHEIVEKYGLDLEKQLWEAIRYTACDLEHDFKNWAGRQGICQSVDEHLLLVF